MLVQTKEQFDIAISTMLDADILAVDTETFWITPGTPTIQMGTVVYGPVKGREELEIAFYFPFRHKHQPSLFPSENLPLEWLPQLGMALEREDLTLIFHNAKFDLAVLERDNIVPRGTIKDTMLMSHMVDENGPHALDALARKHLGEDSQKMGKEIRQLAKILGDGKTANGWHLIPPDAMGKYAEQDAKATYELFIFFEVEAEKQEFYTTTFNGRNLPEREIEYLYLIKEMEGNGVLINQPRAKELAETCAFRRAELQSALGFDPMKPDLLARKLFGAPPSGLGFPVQALGKPSKSHPQGRPVMDKHTLARMNHPVADMVTEYRGLVKAESTWFNGFLEAIWPDGRVHPDFWQHGTVTTRLTCRTPNMQQLPRVDDDDPENAPMRSKVKSIIAAPTGWEVWEYDYSQLEPRLATSYSQQPELIDIWLNKRDFYQEVADTLGITRYQAKQLMLAIMYGAGVAKTAEMLLVTEDQSSSIVAEFWSQYPLLRRAVKAAMQAAQGRGWIRLWTGRRRHFRWPSEYHKAFNSAMQGGGAEIVKESGLAIRKELPEVKIISQVHDSYWFEIPENSPTIHEQIKKLMEWPSDSFHVPFPVEGKQLA